MDVQCFEVKLKADSISLVREWAARMKKDSTIFKELIKKEGILIESVFLKESKAGASLVYYIRAIDIEKAQEIFKASNHPLDIFHRDFMACFADKWDQLECLFDVWTE